MASEKILLIGDLRRELQPVLAHAVPSAQVISVPNVFEAIAELSVRSFTAVLAAAEPIERRPESAVKALRELTGSGRLLLFGHPTLEPLSRKMLEFGVDDYMITPATAGELQQMFGAPAMRIASDAAKEDAPEISEPIVAPPPRTSQLLGVPLADVVLDAMLHSPHDAPSSAISQINTHISPSMKLVFTASSSAQPAVPEGLVLLTQSIRNGTEENGAIHLLLPSDEDQSIARHFITQLSHLFGKVHSLQERHNRLQKLAITDELTGLYNGRYFRHFLSKIIEKARSIRFPVTLLLFDIDNFKKYNDQYGHGVGDEILKQTAALMKKCVRDHDLVARISGDEFAVVFWEKEGPRQPREPGTGAPGRPPQTPVQILERFRRLLSTQHFNGLGPAGQGILTISGGLAVFPYDAQNVDGLIDAADKALMFKAKQSGKNNIYLVGGQGAVE